ncbi:MAG: NfeD family protein [Planctomycetes bacterium]|jgi:membrane-bound serine protease (ClpP class)|nr:NfeD family protein [Planctomycetota bacterium]HNZ67583.1 NfeD family protein [Planctomycetota bacterium]HON44908.1 NfeD family protein [Planctomycetota bacterium]HPY74571.1 NfeD family protein [Planctomycetota bacterium]HQB00210.1 NfeD family protein [Planctomycetota bacterium]
MNFIMADLGILCLLYFLGLCFIFFEFYVPGGILGILGGVCITFSIYGAFAYHSKIYGLALLGITVIFIPLLIIWWLKRVTLHSSQNVEDGFVANDETLESLLGQEGVSITLLRPSGTAKIGNRRIDVVSDCDIIPANTPIKVIKVEGYRILVQRIEKES